MKQRITKLSVLLLASLTLNAQKKSLTIIEGNVDKKYVKEVRLYKVVEGHMVELTTQQLDEKGNYAISVPNPKEGFYYLSDCFGQKEVRTRVYLTPGEYMTINLHDKGYDVTAKSEENQVLDKWQQMVSEIMVPAYQFWTDMTGYPGFFPKLNAMIPKAEAFKKEVNTKNKVFNDLMLFVIDNDMESAALEFISTPRTVHPTVEEYPAFYNTIRKDQKYCDTRILQLGDGATNRISLYTGFCLRMDMPTLKIDRSEYSNYQLNKICNDTVKGAFFVAGLRNYRTFDDLQAALAKYQKYVLTDSQKVAVNNIQHSLASFAKGEKALNFSYEDINGKKVSFSDLKGKVVLVDVWATWCGPCRKEIPSLQKLEEELKDKNIAFVSVSVDNDKDKETWKKMVNDQKMTGIQLFCGTANDISTYYKIAGIPRFMVFDQKGNIVTVDSPRPSEPALKDLLLKTVQAQ